jgi:predicted metal-dependent hydrolase
MTTTVTATATTQATDLTVRKFLVNLEGGFPRHWHSNDAFLTQYYNAFSMSFPLGEQSFIDAIRDCLPLLPAQLRYDQLRADVKGFIGQEATHRRVHERYNEQLSQQGLVNSLEGVIEKRLQKFKAIGIHKLNFLAATAAYEHMTAVFADMHLERGYLLDQATPDMQALWRWHSCEESEHRHVAFDLYQACGGSYRNRIITYLHAMFLFNVDIFKQTVSNLWHDKTLFKVSTLWSATRYFWHPTRGMVWAVMKPFAQYLSRDFHPWKNQSPASAKNWLDGNRERWQAVGGVAMAG